MAEPAVILVHGLWMTGAELFLLKKTLGRGFSRVPLPLPDGPAIARPQRSARLKEFINRRAGSETYLVGHSLGGVQTLQRFSDLPIDKVVCLGSPLADTEVSLLC